jgi:lysosomal acid phosphatase
MSALSNLAGFYPPKGQQIWEKEINWQPIPVHTIPEKADAVRGFNTFSHCAMHSIFFSHPSQILAAKKNCPTYEYTLRKLKESDEYQKFNKKHKSLYEYITLNTGRVVNSMEGLQMIYNCLYIEEMNNKT